jgi:hypothetical protein
MYKVERKVTLLVKPSSSSFFTINAIAIGPRTENLGSNTTATHTITANNQELKYYLRNILGINPDSQAMNWDGAIRTYLDSISINVPMSGKDFNIGLLFDINSIERKEFIADLIKTTAHVDQPTITNSEELAKLVMATKKEEEYFKYASPINPVDYVSWRYCLVHGEVANNINDVNRSSRIRFYLYTDAEDKQRKAEQFKLTTKVMNKELEVLQNVELTKNILFALNSTNEVIVNVTPDILSDEILLGSELRRVANAHPAEFLRIANDTKLKTKANIEKLIKGGLLRRLPDTSIIVDATDSSLIIGRTLDEAVIYYENEVNKAQISEYIIKYKTLSVNV